VGRAKRIISDDNIKGNFISGNCLQRLKNHGYKWNFEKKGA